MTRPICLQVYISRDLSTAIREASKARRLSMSEWVRTLLANACEEAGHASPLAPAVDRISRQSVFIMVGIDALLSGHSDPSLRERAHQAYARKCRELGLANTVEGGEA